MEPGLHNAHKDVNVGRLVVNPKPFSLFGFTFMELITWTLALIALFSDLNRPINGSRSSVYVQYTHACS
jgi:hypothetical protein